MCRKWWRRSRRGARGGGGGSDGGGECCIGNYEGELDEEQEMEEKGEEVMEEE